MKKLAVVLSFRLVTRTSPKSSVCVTEDTEWTVILVEVTYFE